MKEKTVRMLLDELLAQFNIDMVKDTVCIQFYQGMKVERMIVGRFYLESTIGEYLFNKMVRKFDIEISPSDDHYIVDINIVLKTA